VAGQCAGEAISEQESLDIIKERLDKKHEWLDSGQCSVEALSKLESLDSMEKRLDSKQERMRSYQCHLIHFCIISAIPPAINYRRCCCCHWR
jgi:hypothetical protein